MTLLSEPWPEHPELVTAYDVECADRLDHAFYLRLAADLEAGVVADVGCGTGVFAVDAAASADRVIGVDPAGAALDVARSRPGGAGVEWLQGGSELLPRNAIDLAIMMGHVAQYFVDDADWMQALADIQRALLPAGHLAFECRNPSRGWASRWTRERTEATFPHPADGSFTSWVQVRDVSGPDGSFTMTHEGNTVLPDGTHLRTLEQLRFRSPTEIVDDLERSGFAIVQTWGDWNQTPFHPECDEFIVLARRA